MRSNSSRVHCQASSAVILLLVLFWGCVVPEPKVPTSAVPSPTKSYIGVLCSNESYADFGFRLLNEQTEQTYVLLFEHKANLVFSLMAVPPGWYRVSSWIGPGGDNALPPRGTIGGSFKVEAGEVALLGHWLAYRGAISSMPIDRREAAMLFEKAYPHFAKQYIICVRC
jgi:hypothetical protein